MNQAAAAMTQTVDFASLPFAAQKAHFLDVARRALPLWGYPSDCRLTLLNITENATYRVEHEGLPAMVMRVHRLAYAERDSIRTEIAWLLALRRETDLSLAAPLPALDGGYVQSVDTPEMGETRHVVCFSYVPGRAPRDSHDDNEKIGGIIALLGHIPKRITVPLFCAAAVAYSRLGHALPAARETLTPGDIAMYRRLGAVAATLRTHSRQWPLPPFYRRIEWDWKATFGEGWNNFYGAHYRDAAGILTAADIAAIDACVFIMRKRVEAYGKAPDRYGLIHSDLRMGNLLQDGDRLTVLDFDDCGRGWYMYDIAGIVGFMEHRPDLPRILRLIVEGYRSRAPLSAEDEREIPTFVMMRRIGLLQALLYHLPNTAAGRNESAQLTPEIFAFYAKGTAELARAYADHYRDMPLPAPGAAAEESAERKDDTL